jgi:hypothetical protein
VAQPLNAAGISLTFSQAGHDKRRIISRESVGEQSYAPSADPDLNTHRADGADGADGRAALLRGRSEVTFEAVGRVEQDDIAVEEDYPRSAWDPDAGSDGPQGDLGLVSPFRAPDLGDGQ